MPSWKTNLLLSAFSLFTLPGLSQTKPTVDQIRNWNQTTVVSPPPTGTRITVDQLSLNDPTFVTNPDLDWAKDIPNLAKCDTANVWCVNGYPLVFVTPN